MQMERDKKEVNEMATFHIKYISTENKKENTLLLKIKEFS